MQETVHHPFAVDLYRQGGGKSERDLFSDQEGVVDRNRELLFGHAIQNAAQWLRSNEVGDNRRRTVVDQAVYSRDICRLDGICNRVGAVKACDDIGGHNDRPVEDSQPDRPLNT